MGETRAYHYGISLAGKIEIVRITSATSEQGRILLTRNRLADRIFLEADVAWRDGCIHGRVRSSSQAGVSGGLRPRRRPGRRNLVAMRCFGLVPRILRCVASECSRQRDTCSLFSRVIRPPISPPSVIMLETHGCPDLGPLQCWRLHQI